MQRSGVLLNDKRTQLFLPVKFPIASRLQGYVAHTRSCPFPC